MNKPHPCQLILLFHVDDDLSYTLEQLFGSRDWINIDLAKFDNICKLRNLIDKNRSKFPINICLQHGHCLLGRNVLMQICMNNRQYRFNVVIHCNEYIPKSIQPVCILNMDYILLQKDAYIPWHSSIFKDLHISEYEACRSTCNIVGISHRDDEPFFEWKESSIATKHALDASRDRIRDRCSKVFQELMEVTWHPDRIKRLLNVYNVDWVES